MKKLFKIRTLIIALSLGIASNNAFAQLSADKTDIDSTTGKTTINAVFPQPVSGDLYVAALVGTQFLFIGGNGGFTFNVEPFLRNGNFSAPVKVLELVGTGIPSGTYSLFQVVAKAGTSPLDVNNWIGGAAGLSELKFNINTGKTLYKNLTCGSSACHGEARLNKDKILTKGTTLAGIKAAINSVAQMRALPFIANASNADLQAIADYLKAPN